MSVTADLRNCTCVLLLLLLASIDVESNTSSKIDVFKTWLTDNSVDTSSLEIVDFGGKWGLGVRTVGELSDGDQFLSIPASLVMCVESAHASTIGKTLKAIDGISDEIAVSLHVLSERSKGNASFWFPYLSIIPDSFPGTPLYLSTAEVALLKDSPTGGQTALSIISFFEDILPKLQSELFQKHPEEFRVTDEMKDSGIKSVAEGFRWALAAVRSRAWAGSSGSTHAMVPLLDCLNHRSLASTATVLQDDVGRSFRLAVNQQYAAGDQVFLSYETRGSNTCNADLLSRYGFVEEAVGESEETIQVDSSGNSADATVSRDCVPLRLQFGSPNARSALDKLKLAVLSQHGVTPQVQSTHGTDLSEAQTIRGDGGIPADLMSMIRIYLARPSEVGYLERAFLPEQRQDDADDGEEGEEGNEEAVLTPPVTLMNELRALRTLSTLLSSLFRKCSTSLSEDEAQLEQVRQRMAVSGDQQMASGAADRTEAAILVVRVGEKRALLRALREVKLQWLDYLENDYDEQMELSHEKPLSRDH